MKKIILSAFIIFSSATFSQELDEAYLESLPEGIRDDVLSKIKDRDESEKPVYRRPSTMIDKPFEVNESLSGRFGNKIFSSMQSSFMPINEPNFDSSYILDYGDTLQVHLIGQKDMLEELSIKRDGSINVPEIGKLFLSGLSLESASSLIKAKVKSSYIGVEAYVTLVNIRDIQVLVSGNAFNPGIYTLNGNSNVLHALSMAGGIDEKGSFRQIDLIRNNKVINTLDLYDIFINGSSSFISRLRTGDSILVRPVKILASISGAVNRPYAYELVPGENFEDLLEYANGFSDTADRSYIRVESLGRNEVTYRKILENELSSITPKSGDNLYIKNFNYRTVTIQGWVNTPGTYYISENETLSSLIKKAEGYKKNAYPFAGTLINKKTLLINQEAKERLYTSFIQSLISKSDALFSSESLPLVLDELKKTPVSGRVMADFDLDVIEADTSRDTSLEDGDEIIIPELTQQVYIYGEINSPGTIRYQANHGVSEYLTVVGGVLKSGDDNNIFVVHPNGEVEVFNNSRLSFSAARNDDILIFPGSIIYVPRAVSTTSLEAARIWSPILSAISVSIASLSILNQ